MHRGVRFVLGSMALVGALALGIASFSLTGFSISEGVFHGVGSLAALILGTGGILMMVSGNHEGRNEEGEKNEEDDDVYNIGPFAEEPDSEKEKQDTDDEKQEVHEKRHEPRYHRDSAWTAGSAAAGMAMTAPLLGPAYRLGKSAGKVYHGVGTGAKALATSPQTAGEVALEQSRGASPEVPTSGRKNPLVNLKTKVYELKDLFSRNKEAKLRNTPEYEANYRAINDMKANALERMVKAQPGSSEQNQLRAYIESLDRLDTLAIYEGKKNTQYRETIGYGRNELDIHPPTYAGWGIAFDSGLLALGAYLGIRAGRVVRKGINTASYAGNLAAKGTKGIASLVAKTYTLAKKKMKK
ncbi:MAG TPA: hypothetical protein VJK03_02025 [Candidatus Nanoarchaeia archaeon]|nr:hypothetical protein [Candidatus Nanoarchaeia archaeon]